MTAGHWGREATKILQYSIVRRPPNNAETIDKLTTVDVYCIIPVPLHLYNNHQAIITLFLDIPVDPLENCTGNQLM